MRLRRARPTPGGVQLCTARTDSTRWTLHRRGVGLRLLQQCCSSDITKEKTAALTLLKLNIPLS